MIARHSFRRPKEGQVRRVHAVEAEVCTWRAVCGARVDTCGIGRRFDPLLPNACVACVRKLATT